MKQSRLQRFNKNGLYKSKSSKKSISPGSSPGTPTMIAVYKLNGKILKTTNLEKKLSKLKSEPEILYKKETGTEADLDKWIQDNLKEKNDDNEDNGIKKYYYINKEGCNIVSIYDTEFDGYVKCTKDEINEAIGKRNVSK